MSNLGLIHVYYGTGKGKTTAALGLALRACGAGLSVGIVQFMKGYPYSEVGPLIALEGVELVQTGRPDYIYKGKEKEMDIKEARRGLDVAKAFLSGGKDLVILDEISVAVDFGLISEKEVLQIMDSKPEEVELVLTGRDPSEAILDRADYLSEIICRRHPYDKGVLSREGIDH